MMRTDENDATFVRVCARSDVTAKAATIVQAGRHEVAIFEVNGEVRAYENCCPHQGGPIGEGIVDGQSVTCPWHAWCFDLRDGRMTLGDFARLRSFDARTENGDVYVATEPVPE